MKSAGEGPVDPGPCRWILPDPRDTDHVGLAGVGADLEPSTLIEAYKRGIFPMPMGDGDSLTVGWWSPDPRGILPLDNLRVTRSLQKSRRDFSVTVDTAFARVVEACADPRRDGAWINESIFSAYNRLHEMGWAHSVEVWSHDTGELAGGLYGVAIGGLFAGESMFHWRTDASKVALCELIERLKAGGGVLLDCQWQTQHLASLGCVNVERDEYLDRLQAAVAAPQLLLR